MANKKQNSKDRNHENFLEKTSHSMVVGILIGISYLPFWVLFGISDFFYLVTRYLVKYRYKVITENLTHAFPEKSDSEIKAITNKFYRHFCDVFVETIKAYSISEKQLNKRIKFNDLNVFRSYYKQGRSLILFGMHYNNWEWSSFSANKQMHDVQFVYNPIRGNQAFERFITHIRSRWGAETIPVNRSSRLVLTFGKTDKPAAIWLGADQAAMANSKFWTTFLNREAPFFSGPEKIAHISNQPVFLHVTRKVKRGKYVVDFVPLFDKPNEVEPKEILLTYIRKMEEIIREEPAYYLWSHRRWKHTRPEGIPLQ
ncbi:MAG: lysophospholipid acyltransferase family protein [Bacteroidetes bacterium]|nr:lysophospholipid acyltransferase family protein [Bacteroidota bacterium]